MIFLKRFLNSCACLLLCNGVFLFLELPFKAPVKLLLLLVLGGVFLYINLRPYGGREDLPQPLRRLGGGRELLLLAGVCAIFQVFFYLYLGLAVRPPYRLLPWAGNTVFTLAVTLTLMLNAMPRLFISSVQLTARHRLLMVSFWWLPVVNLFVFGSVFRVASEEFHSIMQRRLRNESRRAEQVCRTRYPILMVHGIFFRDWKAFNYWGRIPAELSENGASVYYGKQTSSDSVEKNAEALAESIREILAETGAEKVNIIAHSKGGLDSRYAISRLGMSAHVASLTTINTPHRGCRFARHALDGLPEGLVGFVSKQYNLIFEKLGDDDPDFFSGVSDLTDERCRELNELMPDIEGVLYRSVGSRMKSASSAAFPLNMAFGIVKAVDGDNDGLVAVESMPWGEHRFIEPAGKRGVSHGDVIDLTRKDIPGFDVCEFYVGLVKELKEAGL